MATEKIQELADEYGIPTEVVEEYIEYMGFEADEVDSLNYYGSFKNESDFAEQLVDEGVITDLGRYLYMTETDMRIFAGEEADNRVDNMDDEEILDETGDSYSPDEVDDAREYLKSQYYDEIYEELEKDAVEYFVDQFGYREEDLAKESIFSVDYDKLGDDLQYDYDYIMHDGYVYVFNNYKRGGMTYRGGGIVTNLDDAFASIDLKNELKHKMQEGDTIVAFAYTDYGGDFFDKVAIEYFKENHPENIVVERTAYNGQNGIVFGEPASEFLEAYESYILGYEDMENFYYQMENEETEDSFEFFLRDLNNYGGYKVSERAMDWLMENKGGYYSMTTQGLDFNSSDLEQELLEEGLIKKEDDDDDEEFTDEENYAKGGYVYELQKKRELDDYLSDPDGSGFGIFGYTDRIHEIMMGRDDEFKPSQLNDYLSDPDGNGFGIFGYTRGIKEIYEDEKYAKGGNVPTIEKRVAEVNALIKEGNEKGVEVYDESTTWQSARKYNPIKYSNGVLYVSYMELDLYKYKKSGGRDSQWKKENFRVGKNELGMSVSNNSAQKETLTDIARMYRKAIKHFDTYGYAEGGEVSRKKMLEYLNMYFEYYDELRTIAVEEDNILTKKMLPTLDDEQIELAYEDAKYEIKSDTEYVEGGETDSNTYEKVKVTIKDVDMGGDVVYKNDHWFRKDQLSKKTNKELGDFILRKYGLDYGNTYKYSIVRTGETKQKMARGGFNDKDQSKIIKKLEIVKQKKK